MIGTKKIIIRIFILLYALSYFLQNSFFINRRTTYAATNTDATNLVAVFVDKEIYPNIKTNIIRYTSKYIQKKISNSKTIVLPIDTTTLKAHEISQILENMYFEGLEDEPSKLIGTILIGDIPLPVVENNGFIYPSIFPYVDFENQQFIYDSNKKFFVYNDNPNGQAEIRHSLITFDTTTEYNTFFTKLRAYYNDPTEFIDKAIRYDDFIGLKKYFIPENTKYYVNSIVFGEDIGYHRYNPLLLGILTDEHNTETVDIGKTLSNDMQNIEDPELKSYATMIQERSEKAEEAMKEIKESTEQNQGQQTQETTGANQVKMPTLTLKKSTDEMLKSYNGLISDIFSVKIKDNIAGLGRRYTNNDGESFTAIEGSMDKIMQQDNRFLGDNDNNVEGLLIMINNRLEDDLNTKIQEEKYYMNIPIPISELNFEGDIKIPTPGVPKCIRKTYDYYHNYYFGKDANLITSAQDTSIYRGTYKTGTQTTYNPLQSIGGSYKIFSTQIEANKGYNIGNATEELVLYNTLKIHKQDLRSRKCNLYMFGYCFRWKKTREAQDNNDEDKCETNDEALQGGCETVGSFVKRYRGGASPINLNANQELIGYNYKDAKMPIYNIAGSKQVQTPELFADSYIGAETYASLIQERFAVKERIENKYTNVFSYIANPKVNGIDLKFTNQKPTNTNLSNPIRGYNPPKTYAQNNFFTIYNTVSSHIIYGGKVVLYNRTNPTDIGNCNMKGHIYTYKTIDSRVKNTSPEWDQINDSEFYKFKNDSDLEVFYNKIVNDLTRTVEDIEKTINNFSGVTVIATTGVISNLNQIKNMIQANNNGLANINSLNVSSLSSYTTAQINALANTRNTNNITQVKSDEIKERIKNTKEGLDGLLNYLSLLGLDNTQLLVNNIIQNEAFKKQKVEILNAWKANIYAKFNQISSNINILKTKTIQAQNIYPTIGQLNNMSTMLNNKRTSINELQTCGTSPNTYYCGCANTYGQLCAVLQNIKTTLDNNLTDINQQIIEIEEYQDDTLTIKPFIEINTAFTPNLNIISEIVQIKNKIDTFDISTNPDKKEIKKGMNITTSDRPIDNIRNITFKGIGGDMIRLTYPNLYEIEVYQETGDKLILKTIPEIREAIKNYLTNKATEYNTLLQTQQTKKTAYYGGTSAQFDLLGQLDPLANPNRNYNLIPTDYFIKKLVAYLDDMQNEFGTKAIYGKTIPTTDDAKIDMIAKFLYKHNIARPEKMKKNTVMETFEESKESFDINQKISNTVKTYLTRDNDQGKFLTPTYNEKGYEIGYINSDGYDYVSAKEIPNFIKQVQTIQENAPAPAKANNFIEDNTQTNELQKNIDSCEGVDVDGTALLFDFKTMKSPWFKAMKCRAQQTLEKPMDIRIIFDQALGPVFLGQFKEISNDLDNFGNQWKEYGSQWTAPDNKKIIEQTSGTVKEKLIGYNTSATTKIDKKIIGVDDNKNATLQIGMLKNMDNIRVKISGAGDNCFGIMRKGVILSDNICTKNAEELYNPYTEDYIFDIILKQKKAGSTSIYIEFCTTTLGAPCIIQQEIVHIVPGPITNIQLETPTNIVMEGAELPLIISAKDKYDNPIGKSVESYAISVKEGDGKISDGSVSLEKIELNDFGKSSFIYQAPINLQDNKGVAIMVSPVDTTRKTPMIAQKNISVVKGIVTIKHNDNILYKTDTQQTNQQEIIFKLPKNEEVIQYRDNDDIAQIVPKEIPSINIDIRDRNNTALETVAYVSSKQGLLMPGIIKESKITKGNTTKTQLLFSKANNFIVKDGKLDITLYPSFKAGNDIITIQIPGIDPIIIPITVHPGIGKKVILNMEKTKMDLTVNTESKGIIQVVDTWNNKVNTGTTIKLGVIGSAETNVSEFSYTGGEYTYTITARQPGGEGYIFAYIKERDFSDQIPAYERFIIQENILPKEKLNIMYLNLFGTDRGNQRGYFSEHNKTINTITTQSEKLLATTTSLIDPNKIKEISYIINPHGQIQSIKDEEYLLTMENKQLMIQIPNIAHIYLGPTNTFKIQQTEEIGNIADIKKESNLLIYIPEPSDSIITNNQSTASKITINDNQTVIDLTEGTIDPLISITADNTTEDGMSIYTISLSDKILGKLAVRSKAIQHNNDINIQDPITYGATKIFSEGSTNTQGIGIYIQKSVFTKQGYISIEDSNDPILGIGFSDKFKNISNFANGKSVGESTIPYGSHFLINFGDPLLERRDKNPEIPETDFDAGIGQTIYTDPTKKIFKTIPIDFNKDGLKDLLIIYDDGTIKLLKNYGGTHPYKEPESLMIIADTLKDVHVGDMDGNGYDDIMIITRNNKGVVYLNNEGIFGVDGRNICLNTSADPGTKKEKPDDFSDIKQLFIEDMDQDGILDIITNDEREDTKIFYGGKTGNEANYISSIAGSCDENRYQRQKNNYVTVKRFGIKVNNSRYIQDSTSLVRRKGLLPPKEGKEEETEETGGTDMSNYTEDQLKNLKDEMIEEVRKLVQNTNSYIAEGAKQLAYTENPLNTKPIYETTAIPEDIYYLPIDEENEQVSVYKEYTDINGGILKHNDEVVIRTTIISKKNNNNISYIDVLNGPWAIEKNNDNIITSFLFGTTNTGGINVHRDVPEEYQFMIDNIKLNANEKITFSYIVKYQKQTISTIDVKDTDLLSVNKTKDNYPDIIIYNTDPCQKGKWILFNEKIGKKRTYETIFHDIQTELNTYNTTAQETTENAIHEVLDQISSIENLDDILKTQGVKESLEKRTPADIFNRGATQGGSINISTNFIDAATSNVSKKIDETLQGLCQGFSIGKGKEGCQGIPVPFNQAFLAPGNYHLFGCVPKPPNPLYIPFKVLNETLGKGLPILAFPTDSIIPIRPPSPIGAGGILQGTTSQFRLYIVPTLTLGLGIAMCFGPYSLGKKIPKPFADMGGNCIVFALPPITKCPKESNDYIGPQAEKQSESIIETTKIGTCNNPPKVGNSIVFATDNQSIITHTASSPFQAVASFENTCESCDTNYAPAIPQGNFGGLIQIEQTPITITSTAGDTDAYEGYKLEKGENINLKILGAKTKGLVQCVVQDRTTRQISYIENNLTKMTIQIDFPDVTSIFQGFDTIGKSTTLKAIQDKDKAAGYIQTENTWQSKLSKQQRNNISETVGQNPFEAFVKMFDQVPLITMNTKDINIKIPALTSDDIIKYQTYLSGRVYKNAEIMEDRTDMLNQMLVLCGTTSKEEARTTKEKLIEAKNIEGIDGNMASAIQTEIDEMDKILNLPEDTTFQEIGSDIKNIGLNASYTAKKISAHAPIWDPLYKALEKQKEKEGEKFKHQTLLDFSNSQIYKLKQCDNVLAGVGNFITFRENTADIIRSIKQNINVLEKYKEFPLQLHERTHVTDRYLTEISLLISTFTEDLLTRANINANRYAGYVDAIVLLIGAIKTWQAIIDFSINRSEKCSKCSNDNYGSFSCSLSFLCPKLPIFPIPSFKIPSIYMDLSHIELGIDMIIPKFNFVPTNIPLPQIPDIPEPPKVEMNLDINFFANMLNISLPTIPVIPEPPTLPELPSFIPIVKMDLPVLPPAPKIPKLIPEIGSILKVAEFIGKVFCIVKGGIGLVGEASVKGKVEQMTQRTRNVPIFDFFDLTTKHNDPPLQGFDYEISAYTQLKFNFDGVYDMFNNIAKITNNMVAEKVENPIKKAIEVGTEKLNNNQVIDELNKIQDFEQSINFDAYHDADMMEHHVAYEQLRKGLVQFQNSTLNDKYMNNKIKNILALIDNQAKILPATNQIEQVENTVQSIINKKREENKKIQKDISDYEHFIQELKKKEKEILLVSENTTKTVLETQIMTIDTHTKNILVTQESPTKTYLNLNQQMVQGYLDAINNDGPEKLNMTPSVYKKSKTYLETTKEHIDTALLAFTDTPFIAQSPPTSCTNCSNTTNNYSPDISAYVQGVFVESYSGTEKSMINTMNSTEQIKKIQQNYLTDIDINNDKKPDIISWDANTIFISYAQQNTEQLSKGNNSTAEYYSKFYSYANEYTWNRYIKSLDQLRDNSDAYGFIKINDIKIKIIDKNKEAKNFKTEGQTFDNIQLSRSNSKTRGEKVDGYIIKVSKKIDDKDAPSSFRDFLGIGKKPKYIIVLPKDTEYQKGLITIDKKTIKKPINLELGNSILAIEYFDPQKDIVNITIKNLPRERMYTNIATLTITQEELNPNQRNSLTLYKKTSPRSNQTVAGMQNIGDITGPIGEIVLWRNITNEAISTGLNHQGYINTRYTLRSTWTDNVIVSKIELRKDGIFLTGKNNQSQTGTLDRGPLFFTGNEEQMFDFVAIDQNENITRETVRITISTPEIEIIDVKKTGEETAEIIAKISNDLDEGTVTFQRWRNSLRQNIEGTEQNQYGGFDLLPKQTIITGSIFTLGKSIGLYDKQGNEVAIIDPDTGEIIIKQEYQNRIKIHLQFNTHIPVIEIRDNIENIRLFQMVLPIKSIVQIQMHTNIAEYKQIQLIGTQFGMFDGGYCIKNMTNECIIYTNQAGAIYIPGIYANSLIGEYIFDNTTKNTILKIKDQTNKDITSITVQIQSNK